MAQVGIQQRGAEILRAGDVLVVVHDFDSRSADELSLRKGDRLELVELDEGFGDGWYLGRLQKSGMTGLFPGTYTARLATNPATIQVSSIKKPINTSIQSSQSRMTDSFSLPPIPLQPSNSSSTPPAPYQHFADPGALEHRPFVDGTIGQGQSSYDGSRNTMLPPQTTHIPSITRSIGQTLGNVQHREDSPVMNETLSVINEHITDLSTPRHSLVPPQRFEDSSSEYSSHVERASFVAGPETDDEDNKVLTLEEVSQWDHKQTAQHLRSIGVDSKHCDIFEEQEITGDVLLEMDQSFLYMKEYNFGVMGRRMKTWYKIRDFQNEVRGEKHVRQPSTDHNGIPDDITLGQTRPFIGSTILPRIPSLMEKPGLNIRPVQHVHQTSTGGETTTPTTNSPRITSPSAWRASAVPESPSRPSAALVRDISHSRRHSLAEFSNKQSIDMTSSTSNSATTPHHKHPSFDRNWSMGNTTPTSTNATTPSIYQNPKTQGSLEFSNDSPLFAEGPNLDFDRGYFSGNELDNRKARNSILRKRESGGSPAHSRQSSAFEDPRKASAPIKRHSRLSSVDSTRDHTPQLTSPAARAYYSKTAKGRMRSASAQSPINRTGHSGGSPTVTNLENAAAQNLPSPLSEEKSQGRFNMSSKARKMIGLRAASDMVTANEKEAITNQPILASPIRESPVTSADGSRTPSVTSRSIEVDNTDTSSKGTDAVGVGLSSKTAIRPKPKTKQQTSAYTRGLLKISPGEARKDCDYHGWMKKKSSSLITTWKPRLFILRGRRLSYYYSETDTEERGIIDISGHKVLVANSDAMITLHAQLTGAANNANPGSGGTSQESSPAMSRTPSVGNVVPFYFKLVPPRAGLSRAVQFTKPTVHYFQVNSIIEGRKWMGEIMKATIEHDLTNFESTNKQKTISLAKARARKERPPALREIDTTPEPLSDSKTGRESGLNIQGLSFEESNSNLGLEGHNKRGTVSGNDMSALQGPGT